METEVGRCLAARATHASHRAVFHRLGLSVGIAIALAGCKNDPPLQQTSENVVVNALPSENAVVPPQQAELDAEILRERRIEEIRHRDPALNWVNIGISTGKFSESVGTSVHKTYEECVQRSTMEDNECFPVSALPKSYWDAEAAQEKSR